MSNIPDGLYYSTEDEWVRVEGGEATMGITDYAQDALSDIVYVELPDEGDAFGAGEVIGVIESVKAASDMYTPVSGDVTAVNGDILDSPETLNSDPYGDGWLVKIKLSDPTELEALMDAEAYSAYCDSRA